MITKYLVKQNFKGDYIPLDNWDDVLRTLRVTAFEWCELPNYQGPPWEELFHECMDEENFHDIANVFELQSDSWEMFFPKPNQVIQFKRIL